MIYAGFRKQTAFILERRQWRYGMAWCTIERVSVYFCMVHNVHYTGVRLSDICRSGVKPRVGFSRGRGPAAWPVLYRLKRFSMIVLSRMQWMASASSRAGVSSSPGGAWWKGTCGWNGFVVSNLRHAIYGAWRDFEIHWLLKDGNARVHLGDGRKIVVTSPCPEKQSIVEECSFKGNCMVWSR